MVMPQNFVVNSSYSISFAVKADSWTGLVENYVSWIPLIIMYTVSAKTAMGKAINGYGILRVL